MNVSILSVDDDRGVLDLIQEALESGGGMQVECAETYEKAWESLQKQMPDLLILDWNIGNRSGLELCERLRKNPKTSGLPILLLTAVTATDKKVDALNLGADDYLTKPFQVSELLARVRAVLRRKTPWLIQSQVIAFGDLHLDPSGYKALLAGKDIKLTKIEFEILYLLLMNAGNVVQRSYIENRVLDKTFTGESRSLDVHISHLRSKVGAKMAKRIETMRNLGYIFNTL